MTPEQIAQLANADDALYALLTDAESYEVFPGNDLKAERVTVPNVVRERLNAIAADVAELKSRPPLAFDPDLFEEALERVVRKVLGGVDNLPPKTGI